MPMPRIGRPPAPITLSSLIPQPLHPGSWTQVESRDLALAELWEMSAWLREHATGQCDQITAYGPALRQMVWFERPGDAVMFRLAWG